MKHTQSSPPERKHRSWQWRFFGLTLGLFLAALLSPRTGWIARQQLLAPVSQWVTPGASLLGLADPETSPTVSALLRHGAKRFPQDVAVQSVYTLHAAAIGKPQPTAYTQPFPPGYNGASDENGESFTPQPAPVPDPVPQALQDVIRRFPKDPMPYALYLRYSTMKQIRIERPEMAYYDRSLHLDIKEKLLWKQVPTALLSAYAQVAQEGERLEPDNAYFPTMLMVAHLANHQDQEAIRDLDRAARKTHWNDYSAQETQGVWRLTDASFGKQGYLSRFSGTMLHATDSGQLRVAARLIHWQAMLQESNGHPEAGIALRSRLMYLAKTMCADEPTWYGIQNGYSILSISSHYPAGERLTKSASEPVESFRIREQQQYVQFLYEHRATKEGLDFQTIHTYCAERSRVAVLSDHFSDPDIERYVLPGWLLGMMLTAEFLLLSLLAAAAALYAYRRRFQPQPMKPLSQTAVLGMSSAGGVVLASLVLTALTLTSSLYLAVCMPMLFLLTLGSLWVALRESRRLIESILGAAAAIYGLVFLLIGLSHGAYLYLATYAVNMNGTSPNSTPFGLTLTLCLCLLALPAALCYVMGVTARVRHQPMMAGGLEAFRQMVVPVLGLLLIACSACVLVTYAHETELISSATRYYVGDSLQGQTHPASPAE